MSIKSTVGLAAAGLLMVGVWGARAESINVTADVGQHGVADVFTNGDVVPVTFYISSDKEEPIFGAEFEIETTSDDVRILSVEFNPAFSKQLGPVKGVLPGSKYRAIRVQPLRRMDDTLGINGEQVELATVELEVLNGTNFESALVVNIRPALAGETPKQVTVLGNPANSRSRGKGQGRIAIANHAPQAAMTANAPQMAAAAEAAVPPLAALWTEEEATVQIALHELGSANHATTLAPNTQYEVHYTTDADLINAFYLSATTEYAAQTPPMIAAPAIGEWAEVEVWDVQAVDNGTIAVGFWWSPADVVLQSGQLCTLTTGQPGITGQPGELKLDIFLDWTDPENKHTISAHTTPTFTVAQYIEPEPAEEEPEVWTEDDTTTNGQHEEYATTNGEYEDNTSTNGQADGEASTNGVATETEETY